MPVLTEEDPMPFYLKEDAGSCRGAHPHGEWCLQVILSESGPNPCVSRSDFAAGLFETPFNSEESAQKAAKVINRHRFGRSLCPACGGPLTSGGRCANPRCSHIHDAIPEETAPAAGG